MVPSKSNPCQRNTTRRGLLSLVPAMSYPFFTKPPGKVCRIAAVYLIGTVATIPERRASGIEWKCLAIHPVVTTDRSQRGQAVECCASRPTSQSTIWRWWPTQARGWSPGSSGILFPRRYFLGLALLETRSTGTRAIVRWPSLQVLGRSLFPACGPRVEYVASAESWFPSRFSNHRDLAQWKLLGWVRKRLFQVRSHRPRGASGKSRS